MDWDNLPLVIRHEQNKRECQEDSFLAMPFLSGMASYPLLLLAVADGIGGHQAGEEISREALSKLGMSILHRLTLEQNLNIVSLKQRTVSVDMLTKLVKEAVEYANSHVKRMVKANLWGIGGTTVVLALVTESVVIVCNLGDSPLFHYQAASAKLTRRTREHTVTGDMLESGLISQDIAQYHEGQGFPKLIKGSKFLPQHMI